MSARVLTIDLPATVFNFWCVLPGPLTLQFEQ